jgi:dihydroorotase
MRLVIKNATVVNYDNVVQADILIDDGKINNIAKKIDVSNADKIIDARGKHVLPAFTDLHTHLRTPGGEHKESLTSGSRAAVKGGFATIFCMANTEPVIDNQGLVSWLRQQSEMIDIAEIIPVGAITKQQAGKELTEFAALKETGCLAVSEDGSSVEDSNIFRKALEYAKMVELLVISHCEDKNLSDGGAIREGVISATYGISGIPAISETIRVFRDSAIASFTNSRLHLAHISCAQSVELIKQAKAKNPYVTAETAPHYFALSVDDLEKSEFDTNYKVNPPLGTTEDVEAIIQGLRDGTIDCIATDHAPHSLAEKEVPLELAPFGFIGLETAFSVAYTYLVKPGIIGLKDLVEKLAFNPAKIAGLKNRGYLAPGNDANLVIADLDASWQVSEASIISRSKNTPFLNKSLDAVIEYTIRNGRIVFCSQDG